MTEYMNRAILRAVVSMVAGLVSASVMSAYDVDSVCVDTVMTKEEVIARFGEPDEYEFYDAGPDGIEEYYHYGKSFIKFHDNVFIEFSICDSSFVALKCSIPEGVRVGDPFEVLAPLSPRRAHWIKGECYALFHDTDCMVFVDISEGKIDSIYYSDPL